MQTMKEAEARQMFCWRKLPTRTPMAATDNPFCEGAKCIAWSPTHLGGGGPQFQRDYANTGRCSLLPSSRE